MPNVWCTDQDSFMLDSGTRMEIGSPERNTETDSWKDLWKLEALIVNTYLFVQSKHTRGKACILILNKCWSHAKYDLTPLCHAAPRGELLRNYYCFELHNLSTVIQSDMLDINNCV